LIAATEFQQETGHPPFIPMLQAEDGAVFTYVNDHLGMPKELVDQDGRVAWAGTHSAWGRVVESWRDPRATQSVETPFRLLGQYADEETGLCYTRFRYFDARTARWICSDPLGISGGTNLFAWDGAPGATADPLGLASNFVFRGDKNYHRGDPVGYPLGSEAAENAQIQTPWDHVSKKQGSMDSRYTSFSEDEGKTKMFGPSSKVSRADLAKLEADGTVRILTHDTVRQMMLDDPAMSGKAGKMNGVLQQMKDKKELLVEGEIPGIHVKKCGQ
jgi:RHS repeat-associated protein